ncbi:MAG: hypothetical protein Q9183_007427, partial [Haloplaca sp. 2 TL-2023]
SEPYPAAEYIWQSSFAPGSSDIIQAEQTSSPAVPLASSAPSTDLSIPSESATGSDPGYSTSDVVPAATQPFTSTLSIPSIPSSSTVPSSASDEPALTQFSIETSSSSVSLSSSSSTAPSSNTSLTNSVPSATASSCGDDTGRFTID